MRKIAASLLGTSLFVLFAQAEDGALSNHLAAGDVFAAKSDITGALREYDSAQQASVTNAAELCVLARHCCDLTFRTEVVATQKEIMDHAIAAAEQAVKIAPADATAHASLAVCYAKSCNCSKLKAKLNYSRLFKQEAEKAIALDPKQDVAWYLLGRWNHEIANVGKVSRAFVKVVYGGLPAASEEEAIKDFNKAIALAPDRILHHAGLASVYHATGQKELEIAELKRCTALKPVDVSDADAQKEAKKRLAEISA